MRISKIKLSGFKSFVDPTTLSLPGNLTGVVGPNGCGKSNIIDALQWVLGESSAKHLRGDSMADVIFNGSSSRKPVGQASVEIVFDNSDASLGGQWANFAEIAIKRLVNRDGVSAYYLNGTRSRRRDITDIFLGTGVGANGYSVIAQGMISRVIEARPEDLRLFLEEAAGISRYKERRRETESRMQRAVENLTRLQDIRTELEKQLSRLQNQARAAEKYQNLKEEERQLSAQLLGLSWRTLQLARSEQTLLASHKETEFEGTVARLRALEAQMEQDRESHAAATAIFNEVQARFYAAGATIARAEQGLQYGQERRASLERDLLQATADRDGASLRVQKADGEVQALGVQLDELQPRQTEFLQAESDSGRRLEAAETAMNSWQAEWDRFNTETSEVLRDERGELTRVQHLEGSLGRLTERLRALQSEATELVLDELQLNVAELADRKEYMDSSRDELLSRRDSSQIKVADMRAKLELEADALDVTRSELQTLRGRFSALQALQQAAFATDDDALQEWLRAAGLTQAPRLAQQLTVEGGWEAAVETVLRPFLDGITVDRLDTRSQAISGLESGSLTLIENPPVADGVAGNGGLPTLVDKVSGAAPLRSVLKGVYLAETVAEALALRPSLRDSESIVLRDGTVVGRYWMRIEKSTDARTGMLKREQEIKQLLSREAELDALAQESEARVDAIKAELLTEAQNGVRVQQELSVLQAEITRVHGEHIAHQTQLEQATMRRERITAEIAEIEARAQNEQSELDVVTAALNSIRTTIQTGEIQRQALNVRREQLRVDLQAARETWSTTRETSHTLALQLEALGSKRAAVEQSLSSDRELVQQLDKRCNELRMALADSDVPLAEIQKELDVALAQRIGVESELNEARSNLQSIDTALRTGERERTVCSQELDGLRSELEALKMECQTLEVRLQSYQEQVGALGCSLESLLAELNEDLKREDVEEQIGSVQKRIARLGPINLAAIDECKDLEERKTYLDSQHEDLTQALATLETAIREIDQETKARFLDTFEKVNDGFKERFPALFGGGQAYLELTGEDLLDTGVTVMARPPGKRNSTIHLLSGGEKALTAVALVFSIFELNPAPFCLLDEVDAPLDDANVVHLCTMLRSMSERVQFLFITHNKITMEIAQRLVGVTMHEPGVSRLVAVDVDDAVKLAAAG